jgi:hypothetical protein
MRTILQASLYLRAWLFMKVATTKALLHFAMCLRKIGVIHML